MSSSDTSAPCVLTPASRAALRGLWRDVDLFESQVRGMILELRRRFERFEDSGFFLKEPDIGHALTDLINALPTYQFRQVLDEVAVAQRTLAKKQEGGVK